MERYLQKNQTIELKGIDGYYTIRDIIGRGSSCVVYLADFYNLNGEKSEHLLKEFNPKGIDFIRDNAGDLCVENEGDYSSFLYAKEQFIKGYNKQQNLRSQIELKNFTANIQNTYHDYGTIYIDMTVTAGQSYADVKEKSVFNLARRIKVLTQVIGLYHKLGYLHLDIKPSNIFVRPEDETCEDVLLFDCDSLVEESKANNGIDLSYTLEWAPIELTLRNRRYSISKATDIFSIGEIFFEKLMGRHSEPWERRSTSEYNYDFNSPVFENTNPKVIPLLDELFRHTICNNPNNRYQTADELIEILDRIIKISNPDEPYLLSSCPKPQEFFVGRESELVDIYNKLKENQVLFLSGMGGIGKSELAKNYAKAYKDCYDAIIFAPYVTDFNAIMSNDSTIPIYNVFKYPAESIEDYSARKLRKFKELCDDKTLLIIDNFNTTEDSLFQEILNLNCHILFTTRVDFSDFNYNQLEINSIADKSKVLEIFNRYYTKPLSNEEQEYVEKIIDITFCHTMTVELLAKQMMAGRVKPQKMLETLQSNGISNSGKERVSSSKDNKLERMSAFDHIHALFDLSNLNEQENYILANLSLMPYTGISTELFCEWCEIESYDTINTLVIEGWIRLDKENDVISLHPILLDVLAVNLIKNYGDKLLIFQNVISYMNKYSVNIVTTKSNKSFCDILHQISIKSIRLQIVNKDIALFLVEAAVRYGYRIGKMSDAVICCEWALDLAIRENYEKLEEIYICVGKVYERNDNFIKANDFVHKALEIVLKHQGEMCESVSEIYHTLYLLYLKQGLYDKAQEYILKELQIIKFLNNGEDVHDTAMAYDDLGITYCYKNELDKAELYILKAHQIWLNIWGENHKIMYNSHHSLGSLYMRQEKYNIAETHFQKAISILKNTQDDKGVDIATSYHQLACLYGEQGNLEKSEEYYLKSIEIMTALYGEISSIVAVSYDCLGEIYQRQHRYKDAEIFYLKALYIGKIIFENEDLESIVSLLMLGDLFIEQECFDRAEKYYIKALDIVTKLYGTTHEQVAIVCCSLGELYYKTIMYEKAKHYYSKAIKICLDLYGENNNEIAILYNRLGIISQNKEEWIQAEQFYLNAYDIWNQIYENTHKYIADVCDNLGSLYLEINKVEEAEEYYLKNHTICVDLYGNLSFDTADALDSLANLYVSVGDRKKAQYYYEKIYETYVELLGKSDKKTTLIKEKIKSLNSK